MLPGSGPGCQWQRLAGPCYSRYTVCDHSMDLIALPAILWFLPAVLFGGFTLLGFAAIVLSFWVILRLGHFVFEEEARTQGTVIGFATTIVVMYSPIFFGIWYYYRIYRPSLGMQLTQQVKHEVLPSWDEAGTGRWMERRGWERAKDSLHVEQDLLSGKSRAAIAGHLEREMRQLETPPLSEFVPLVAPAPVALPPFAEPEPVPTTEENAPGTDLMAEPWRELRGRSPEVPEEDDIQPPWRPPPPKYPPPQIAGVSDYALDKLYGEGKFDEVVAYLATRMRVLRDRGSDTRGVEDYLRLARSQQLHRELEKYRTQYDEKVLLQQEGAEAPTAPAPPHADAPAG